MIRSNVTATEALRRLLAATKLIDYADCKDETVWQAIGAAQGTAEGVLRDGEPSAPTDISRQLRAQAKKPFGPEGFALLEKAAEEIERYYGGMKAWKATAEAKDCRPAPSLPAVVAVPEGWALVPTDVTDDMIVAFAEQWYSKRQAIDDPDMADAYKAMLAVAPQPAAAPSGEVERIPAGYRLVRLQQRAYETPRGAIYGGARKDGVMPLYAITDEFQEA